jgi:hypothetical protein
MSVVEIVVTSMNGPALHRHALDDELWFVLEGEFRFRAGEATLHASTGGMAYGPRGIPHCFQNIGATDGRLLVVTAPSGLDQFFLEYAKAPGDGGLESLNAVAAPYGLEFIGPPLAISDPLTGQG